MIQPTPSSAPNASPEPSPAADTSPCPELSRLGERLRQGREQQQLSLEQLAERLRLGTDQLLALENADPARLPEPVFVIAQAKRVAASLDLDLQAEISALRGSAWMARQGRPSRPVLVTPTPQRPLRPASPAGRRRASRTWARPLGLAAVIVALLAGLAIALSLGRLRLAGPATSPTASPASRPPASPAARNAASGAASARQPRSPAADQLLLQARGTSWVSVRREDGSRLFEGNLEGERSFPLGQGLQVLAGRPDLVSAAVGGQPARPLGPIDAVEWHRFDAAASAPSAPSGATKPAAPGLSASPAPSPASAVSPPQAP